MVINHRFFIRQPCCCWCGWACVPINVCKWYFVWMIRNSLLADSRKTKKNWVNITYIITFTHFRWFALACSEYYFSLFHYIGIVFLIVFLLAAIFNLFAVDWIISVFVCNFCFYFFAVHFFVLVVLERANLFQCK